VACARAVFLHSRCAIHGGCAYRVTLCGKIRPSRSPLAAAAGTPVPRRPVVSAGSSVPRGTVLGRWRMGLHRPSSDPLERGFPVVSFVCALVPGTTRWHAPVAPTALRERHPGPALRPDKPKVQALPDPTGDTLIRVWLLNHRRTSNRRHRTPLRPPHSLRG